MAGRDWGPGDAERVRRAAGVWIEAHSVSRKPPKAPSAQARYVRDNLYGGSTRRMAESYGVTQRTVERWIKGTRRNPRLRDRLASDVRETRRRRAERRARLALRKGTPPPKVKAKGNIGPGPPDAAGTDTKRLRTMPTRDLDPSQTGALLDAYESGDGDDLRDVLADVYGDYFRRPDPADVGGIEWIEFE